MKILITNDDGIGSPVLPRLACWAKKLGEVTVVAPKVEQSGMSHAIDFTRPIEIKKVELCEGVRAYSMDSTPADCVRFAVMGMKERFDLVISGINRGFNLGADIVYSGTVGAIFEASRLGIKGVALSTDPKTFDAAMDRIDDVWGFFERENLLSLGNIYNVNIPTADKGIRVTRQGGVYFTDDFKYLGDDMYEQIGAMADPHSDDLNLDNVALINGYISITPLTSEKTDFSVYNKFKK
ncbi:MAG: 5'/3'-nucleotidase SurE [Clostridia bacterium]|nr:5'/3'-nucleotidase SurE [Clostridia bacterium]